MKAICVDDEPTVLRLTVSLCRELPELDDVECFGGAQEALEWIEGHNFDLALLDIHMPGMNGLELAARIKEKQPDAVIIFLTEHCEYAVDAFALHVSGYLMKPVDRDRLAAEVSYALSGRTTHQSERVSVQTFGNFDILINGKVVNFSRAKAKELLAFLVDRQGSSVSRAEAFSVLWEDIPYDRGMQKQMDVVIRSLRDTLRKNGIDDILEMQSGSMRVRPDKIDCDMYRFFDGDPEAVNSYRGEYMSSYSWASLTEAYMDRHLKRGE